MWSVVVSCTSTKQTLTRSSSTIKLLDNTFKELLDNTELQDNIFKVNLIKNDFDVLVFLLLKCKISATWLVETACIFLIFLIATLQISMDCETQESQAGYTQHLRLH